MSDLPCEMNDVAIVEIAERIGWHEVLDPAQQCAETERCAQVIRLDPAGNDGARLRVVNVGRVDA